MAIQSMIHSIPTLSSPFLYAEDDTYFGKPIPLEKLWENGRVNMELSSTVSAFRAESVFEEAVLKSLHMVESKRRDTKYFYRAKNRVHYNAHIPMMLYPESIDAIWTAFPREMLAMSSRPFRSSLDPHFWSLYVFMDGKQEKHNFEVVDDSMFLLFMNYNYKQVLNIMPRSFMCSNDDLQYPSPKMIKDIQLGYESLFPTQSSFEL
ncbi:hypothetical protein HDU91_002603, partial [Kappamyces sp. JEL0680]